MLRHADTSTDRGIASVTDRSAGAVLTGAEPKREEESSPVLARPTRAPAGFQVWSAEIDDGAKTRTAFQVCACSASDQRRRA